MKIRKFIFPVVLLSIGFGGCKKKTCKDFKTGTFSSPDDSIDIVFSRNDSIQIEESKQQGYRHEYYVNWLNDCNYTLVLKSTNKPDENLLTDRDTLRVAISAIEDDIYQYTAYLNGEQFVGDLKQTGTNPNF